ncbi:hypothetical protein J4Q44_G00284040 [Coregonus suidteri]|uniref:Uncharacterized protein n=1 Tax=Coregonus suidteri TaxID=861788 RepID=A0AAN8QIR6_9TELE
MVRFDASHDVTSCQHGQNCFPFILRCAFLSVGAFKLDFERISGKSRWCCRIIIRLSSDRRDEQTLRKKETEE